MSAKVRVASCVVALGLLIAGGASGQDAGAIVGWGGQVVVPPSALTGLIAVAEGHDNSLDLLASGTTLPDVC